MKMPMGSKKTDAPDSVSSPQYSQQEIPTESVPAISRMMISGSVNFSRNCFQTGSLAGGVSTLAPCFARLRSTSASVSPVSSLFLSISSLLGAKGDHRVCWVPLP